MRKIYRIGSFLGMGIYAEKTEAGGYRFYDDSIGVLNLLIDTSLVDRVLLEFLLGQERYIDLHWEAISKNLEAANECIQLDDQGQSDSSEDVPG